MTSFGSSIFDFATRISPLALAGFALAVLFFIFRQLLAKNIFPTLSKAIGGALLRQIVDRLFVLALVSMLLGFAGYFAGKGHTPAKLPTALAGETFLNLLYSGHYQAAYESLPPVLKEQMTYVAFDAGVRETMSQFSAPPVYRRLKNTMQAAGQFALVFEAEFDEKTHFKEIVTYADTGDGWGLWRFDITPDDWPLPSLAKPLKDLTAKALFDRLSGLSQAERNAFVADEVSGRWLPLPGWTGRVEKIVSHQGARTCDVRFKEETSGVSIVAKGLLDGCRLNPDQKFTLVGRIDAAGDHAAEVSSIRYFLKA